jgi:hypothetical protein
LYVLQITYDFARIIFESSFQSIISLETLCGAKLVKVVLTLRKAASELLLRGFLRKNAKLGWLVLEKAALFETSSYELFL